MKHKRIITIAVTLIMTLSFAVTVFANSTTKTIRYKHGEVDLTGYIAFTNGVLWLEDTIAFWGNITGDDTILLQPATNSYAYITFGTDKEEGYTYQFYADLDNNADTNPDWLSSQSKKCGTKGTCGKMTMWFKTGAEKSGEVAYYTEEE